MTTDTKPAPSPYFQGYLDAQHTNAYISGRSFHNYPPLRYGIGSHAFDAWTQGISDRINDVRMPSRMSHAHPSWRLI